MILQPVRSALVRVAIVGAAFLMVLASPAVAADAKGKVKSVTADRAEVVMSDDAGKSWTITAAKDCKVQLNDKDAKLADLQAGDEITVTYDKDGDRLVARAIRAMRK